MSAIDTYKGSSLGILKDIVRRSRARSSASSIFYEYKDKSQIGKEIFKELYARFDDKKHGFYMDDSKEIGILSQCQSLQALLLLSSSFGLGFDDKHILNADKENFSIREIMDFVIEEIMKSISTEKSGEYKFDASPYDTSRHFDVQYSNVETITWVVSCFLQALKFHALENEVCRWQSQLVEVITYGLKYLNKAFISSPNVGTSNKLEIGWNFTDDCEEPSLYYSFTVCECFVELFETFNTDSDGNVDNLGGYLKYREALRNFQNPEYRIEMDPDVVAKYNAEKAAYEEALSKPMPGKNEFGRDQARFSPYFELALLFKEINCGVEGIDKDSVYGEFEDHCKAVAREVWRLSKEHLADKFFYNDLKTTLTEEDITISTTSDALFNTVYIINIMLDAGLDEDLDRDRIVANSNLESALSIGNHSGELAEQAERADREYNNLFESCQLASQKAIRTYEKLKTQGKEYIVEQFLVGFNESFIVHRDKVKELRKLRMRVFTLMPLLIRTNNVISEYLIKYPQANMKKYLIYILENRYEDNNRFKWIWENDGFFSCSNYYYVSALGEFYSYYESYEERFIANYTQNETARATIKAEYLKELRGAGGEISALKKESKEKDAEIAELKAQLANVETPIEDAVAKVIKSEMKELLPEMLSSYISEAARGLTVDDVDDTVCKDEHKALKTAFGQFLLAVIGEYTFKNVKSGQKTVEEKKADYISLNAEVKNVFIRRVKQFISDVNDSDEYKGKKTR